MLRYVTIPKVAAESGYTENAIRSKIRDGIWSEGQEWKRAPDGRVLIDVDGYCRWVEAGAVLTVHRKPSPARKPAAAHSAPKTRAAGQSPTAAMRPLSSRACAKWSHQLVSSNRDVFNPATKMV